MAEVTADVPEFTLKLGDFSQKLITSHLRGIPYKGQAKPRRTITVKVQRGTPAWDKCRYIGRFN